MSDPRTSDVDLVLERISQIHISDDDLGRYHDGAIDDFNSSRIKGHFKKCGSCAERYATMMHILDTYHEVEVPQEISDRLKSIIASVNLRRAIQASLIAILPALIVKSRRHGAHFAGLNEPFDWQTEDGSLRGRVVENAVYVEVRVWSHLELEGSRITIRIGPLTKEIVLESVPGNQVGGEVRIEGEELEQLADDWNLVFEKIDLFDITSLQ